MTRTSGMFDVDPKQGLASLSERERQVLRLAERGLTNKEIASEIGINRETVLTYWNRIRLKLGGGTRARLVAMSVESAANTAITSSQERTADLLMFILRRVSNPAGGSPTR